MERFLNILKERIKSSIAQNGEVVIGKSFLGFHNGAKEESQKLNLFSRD